MAALSAFLTQLLGFGLAGAPIRFYFTLTEPVQRREFLGTTFFWSAGAAALITALLHAISHTVATAASIPSAVIPLIQLTLWTAWLQVVARTVPLGILRARQAALAYSTVSAAALVGTVGAVFVRVVLLHEGLGGAVRGLLEGSAVTALVAVAFASPDLALVIRREHVRAGLRFGIPLTPHNVAHWLLGLSDRLLIGRFLGAGALGIYYFAYQFASGLQLLISAINSAIMPNFAQVSDISSRRDVDSLARVTSTFLAVVASLTVGLSAVVPSAVRLLAPVDYVAAAPYIPWLLVAIASFGLYCVPVNILTMSLGRTRNIAWITGIAGRGAAPA